MLSVINGKNIKIPGKPAMNAAILHSVALFEPGAKTVPTIMSPTSFGFNLVVSTNAYQIRNIRIMLCVRINKNQIKSSQVKTLRTEASSSSG